MWSMVNTAHWTNWPSAGATQYTPSSWRNYFQMTSIERLISRMQAQPSAERALTGYYTKAFGFDVPTWRQYLNFWAALFQGDLGRSVANFPTSVSSLILGALPYTLALLIPAILLSFWAGNKVGALAARRKALDNSVLPA